jgi:HPt (histidine-containing phosphotransfer) domain-containing protein
MVEDSTLVDTAFIDSLQAKNSEAASQFARLTIQDLETRLLAIVRAHEARDYLEVGSLAHAMKSVAAQCGASSFALLCGGLEASVNQGDYEEKSVASTINKLVEVLKDIKPVLESYI